MNTTPSGFMRWIGSGALILGALIYMVQGIHINSPMERHWIFLGVTAVLGMGGVIAGHVWQEVKGARTFLGLAAATLPVHFSQLGAMFYAWFHGLSPDLPRALSFTAQSGATVLLVTVLTLIICVPVAHLAFSIFARHKAKVLSSAFLLTNALILPPSRDPSVMLAVLALSMLIFAYVSLKYFIGDVRMQTLEARSARLMMLIPSLVIAGRAAFYGLDSAMFGLVCSIFGAYAFFVAPVGSPKPNIQTFFRATGALFMGTGYLLFVEAIMPSHLSVEAQLLLLTAPLAAGMHLLASFSGLSARAFRAFGSWIGAFGLLACAFAPSSAILACIAALGAAALIARGCQHQEKHPLIAGTISLSALCLAYVGTAISAVTVSPWLALIVGGLLFLGGATVWEKKADALRATLLRYRTTFTAWS